MRTSRPIASVLAVALCLALAAPLPAMERGAASGPDADASAARIVHALNRLGYGPRPGDVEKVRAIGLDKWIEQQLHPEQIADPKVAEVLADLPTLHLSTKDLMAQYDVPNALKRKVQEKAADMANASDKEKREARRELLQENGLMPTQIGGRRVVVQELQTAKLLRAIHSERQLDEVLVDFWMNHFNVYADKGPVRYMVTEYERETIRPHAWGKFEDLLRATAQSPAMLFYLDNWLSAAPDSDANKKMVQNAERNLRRGGKRGRGRGDAAEMNGEEMQQKLQQVKNRKRGLNENYAREIMELHTLGVDGGYTQKDVTELARCLTGWTMRNPRGGAGQDGDYMRKQLEERGLSASQIERYMARAEKRREADGGAPTFEFNARIHDNGDKVVLGRTIKSNGRDEGLEMIHVLATHPSTARFISYKLARRFVADEPPKALVERAAAVFTKTDGDIRAVVTSIVTSPEFFAAESRSAKVKTPLEFVVSAVRASGATATGGRALNQYLERMGMPLYLQQPPTGYKDTAEAWVSTGGLLTRLNFALDLAAGRIPGIAMDAQKLAPGAADADSYMADAAQSLLPNGVTDTTRDVVHREASGLDAARIAGLLLGSPEFQRR